MISATRTAAISASDAMKKQVVFLSVFFAAMLLCLSACTPKDRYSTGRLITREEVESMANAMRSTETEIDTEAESRHSADGNALSGADVSDDTVYWTASGSVWHTHADCGYLRNSVSVQKGTVEASGKGKLCSACAKKQAS